jgi:hypothetical protein
VQRSSNPQTIAGSDSATYDGICAALRDGELSYRAIGRIFGTSAAAVCKIGQRERIARPGAAQRIEAARHARAYQVARQTELLDAAFARLEEAIPTCGTTAELLRVCTALAKLVEAARLLDTGQSAAAARAAARTTLDRKLTHLADWRAARR